MQFYLRRFSGDPQNARTALRAVQLSWNLLSEDISCKECYQNRTKDTRHFVQFHWHSSVKNDCHYTDFNDTHNCSVL